MQGYQISTLFTNMIKVKITPKTKRAKDRVNSHGEVMELLQDLGHKFSVKSIGTTFAGNEHWMGWFTKQEAEFKYV